MAPGRIRQTRIECFSAANPQEDKTHLEVGRERSGGSKEGKCDSDYNFN